MIAIEKIREDFEMVSAELAKRGVAAEDVVNLKKLDDDWRKLSQNVDSLRTKHNLMNDKIKLADRNERDQLIESAKTTANELKKMETELGELTDQRLEAWNKLPNILFLDVPVGGENDYELIRQVPETVEKKPFKEKEYLDLVPELIDLERGAKVSGSRFAFLKGNLVRLQLALVTYTLDWLEQEGFEPVLPPVLVNEKSMRGMGYLDEHADEVYQTQDGLYLTGTSEQAIGAMHANEILERDNLPLRYVAYSSCFRREAGSHGKDVRGILRMHQFDKVEMFSLVTPDNSENEHAWLLAKQEELMQALGLPYRVIKLASGDTGRPSAKTYDIETWLPGEGRYRETHSTSNTTDYQARRLRIRYRSENEVKPLHMLNGTAIAIGRILIAIIENYQQENGSVEIPEVLRAYVPENKKTV